ncbi:MAG: hypothetical protein GYA36_17175 [Veillonellaceae bacterium]|nr:hypothetical protein [Veillonellaceae bacterium]
MLNTVLLDDALAGAANPWGVACTADGRWICVSHAGTNELSVIDAPEFLEMLRGLPLVAFSNAAFFNGTSDGYSTLGSGEDVVNVPGILGGVRQRVKLPGVGPRGLAVCGSQVYVAEYFTDSIAADVQADTFADSAACEQTICHTPHPHRNTATLSPLNPYIVFTSAKTRDPPGTRLRTSRLYPTYVSPCPLCRCVSLRMT